MPRRRRATSSFQQRYQRAAPSRTRLFAAAPHCLRRAQGSGSAAVSPRSTEPGRPRHAIPELERLMRVYHAHKTPRDDRPRPRPSIPRERFTEKDVILITYGDLLTQPGKRPLAGALATSSTASCGAPSTPSTSCPSSPTRPTAASPSSTTRRWTRGSAAGRRSSELGATLPADVRRRLQPRLVQEPLVPALPERAPRLRGLLRRLLHAGRHRSRPPAADPAAADVEPAHAVPRHQRAALRLDHLQPGPGRPQLQERAGAAARVEILLYYVRRGADIDPPRRRHLHLARARHALRAPRADPRAGPAVPRRPRRGGAAGGARHRDQRAARRQRQLLRRRQRTKRRWSTTSRCRRWCCTRSTPATARGSRHWAADLRTVSDDRHLLQLPRLARRHRAARRRRAS